MYTDEERLELISKAVERHSYKTQWESSLPKYHTFCNRTVFVRFGEAVDTYLYATYNNYNPHTEVVIVADSKMRTVEYAKFRGVTTNPEWIANIKSGQVSFRRYTNYNSDMFIAYAPEIDTLFVRTLFDVTHTEVEPDDKMDIEARLGI